jgi:hypothetical protein
MLNITLEWGIKDSLKIWEERSFWNRDSTHRSLETKLWVVLKGDRIEKGEWDDSGHPTVEDIGRAGQGNWVFLIYSAICAPPIPLA